VEITSEAIEPCQTQLTIVVPPERIDRAMTEAAQQYARHQRIPGYRPGKVPLARVLAVVGDEPIRKLALERLSEQVAREAVKEQGLTPSAPIAMEVVSNDPFTVRVVVPLEPTVDLGDYRVLRVPRPPAPEVDSTTVDAAIESWRSDLATLEHVDRAAEGGDTMTVHLVGRDADKIVVEDEALTLVLTPEGAVEANVPPAVVDELIGLSAGDAHTFTVTYSELWTQPELQGRDIAFEATVADVLALTTPELTDALAKELAGVESVEALRARVETQVRVRLMMEGADAFVTAAIDALVGGATVSYPPTLLDGEVAGLIADLRTRVERQGFTWARWLELQNKDQDALWAEATPEAERRLLRRLVMTAFVRAENVDVAPDEIDAEIDRLTSSLSGGARRGMPSRDEMRRATGSRLLSNRAVDRLLEIVAPGEDTPEGTGMGPTPTDPSPAAAPPSDADAS
jgi:trigger factor